MDLDIDLKMMEFDLGGTKCDLDPKKTMDFVLFGDVGCLFILPSEYHGSKKRIAKLVEHGDVKPLPPLEVILHPDLLQTHWGWDRLLPWMTGSVPFEDYFGYLEQYYVHKYQDVLEYFKLTADPGPAFLNSQAATKCITAAARLRTADDGGRIETADELNKDILEQAQHFINQSSALTVPARSIVPAACFMCIIEEAKYVYKVLKMCKKKSGDFREKLWLMKFKFSNKIRQVACHILTTYKGPYCEQVSAAMLGMARETSLARRSLHQDSEDHEEIRHRLLELLIIIKDHFPCDSEINYDSVKPLRMKMGKKHTEHLSEPRKEYGSAEEVSPVTIDEIAPSKSLITTNIASPATPSSWSVDHYESDKSNANNKKRKSMGGTQDSEPMKDSGTSESGLQIASDGGATPVTPTTALATSVNSTPMSHAYAFI